MKSFAATGNTFLLARTYHQGLPAHNHQKMALTEPHPLWQIIRWNLGQLGGRWGHRFPCWDTNTNTLDWTWLTVAPRHYTVNTPQTTRLSPKAFWRCVLCSTLEYRYIKESGKIWAPKWLMSDDYDCIFVITGSIAPLFPSFAVESPQHPNHDKILLLDTKNVFMKRFYFLRGFSTSNRSTNAVSQKSLKWSQVFFP